MNITEQIQWYTENTEIRKKEKNQNGEVFTPISIIREMLASIPRSFWSCPNVKVLDPAAGWGQFSTIAYSLFMRGLKDWEPDEERRGEHIIQNILQQVELNPSSVKTLRRFFGSSANIIQGDFLKNKTKEQLPPQFDLVMGNPPQNSGGIKAKNTEANQEHGGETIWQKFVEHSVELLKNEGSFLSFIHPAPWQNDTENGKQGALVSDMDVVRTKQQNIRRTKQLMDVEIPVAWYVSKRRIGRHQKTRVQDWCDNKWRLWNYRKYGFIPTEAVQLHEKLMTLVERVGGTLGDLIEGAGGAAETHNRNQSHSSPPRPLFPVINVVRGEIVVEHTSVNQNELRGVVGRPKLIFANATMGYPILDREGKQWSAKGDTYMMVDDSIGRLRKVQDFCYSDLFLYMAEISRVRQKFLNRKMFNRIPDITKLSDLEIGDLMGEACVKEYVANGGEGRLGVATVRELKRWGRRGRGRGRVSRKRKGVLTNRKTRRNRTKV